jgi:hypothetical protein
MHPLTTNISPPTCDVHRFGFESAGALEIINEYSGLAVAPAHLYCFRRSQAGMPHTFNLAHGRDVMREERLSQYTAYIGLVWAAVTGSIMKRWRLYGSRLGRPFSPGHRAGRTAR